MKDNDEIAVTAALLLVMLLLARSYIIIPCSLLFMVRSDGWERPLLTYFNQHSRNNNQEAQTLRPDLFAGGMKKLFILVGE